MAQLHNGEQFPAVDVSAVGGGRISLSDDLAGSYGVVLIYRGSWCPYCNAQLAAFSRATDTLAALDVRVVALSADGEPEATALVDKHAITFPVGYGADVDKLADVTGAYTNDDPHYLQSTGFVLGPDGRILVAVYSSGAIGRLVADDVVGMIRYLKSQR